ncbi:MAG: peptide chain release factor N(5)-glutamine methyltransferase [Alphaproteobacteria bacterium]|nr:peptide chain release factor N(5)-glutamine methyltransferase [Alphaproteobacteria bacterium]
MTAGSTLGVALAEASRALAEAGFDDPRRQARRLVAAALGLSMTEIFAAPERALDASALDRIAAILERALAREPLSRIVGRREFWGLEFALCSDTLDPRPDSETVVEAVLSRLPDRDRSYRILDLGTGTGCLLLALLSELPCSAGIGVDSAPGAAAAARRNAAALGFAARAHFVVGDWGEGLAGGFDVVVANPPYIATGDLAGLPREVSGFDPVRALDGGPDGIAAYRAIAADLTRLLIPGGVAAVEIGHGQDQAVAALFTQRGIAVDRIVHDLAGVPRCLLGVFPAKDGRNGAAGRKNCLDRRPVATNLIARRGRALRKENWRSIAFSRG